MGPGALKGQNLLFGRWRTQGIDGPRMSDTAAAYDSSAQTTATLRKWLRQERQRISNLEARVVSPAVVQELLRAADDLARMSDCGWQFIMCEMSTLPK